jgi:hypothetical protein
LANGSIHGRMVARFGADGEQVPSTDPASRRAFGEWIHPTADEHQPHPSVAKLPRDRGTNLGPCAANYPNEPVKLLEHARCSFRHRSVPRAGSL